MSDKREPPTPELTIDEKFAERLEYQSRVAALERDLAAAQAANAALITERDEARADAVALREQYGRLCDIFRVNMLRAFPDKSHAEIDAAIEVRKEGA